MSSKTPTNASLAKFAQRTEHQMKEALNHAPLFHAHPVYKSKYFRFSSTNHANIPV
jgi:hypothetical protein